MNEFELTRLSSIQQPAAATAIVGVLAILAIGFGMPAKAQSDDPAVEEIVVTGSYIKRKDFETASPIQTIGFEDIAKVGAFQPQDLLRTLTINTGSELSSEGTLRQGVSQFNLRGLGLSSTLTLLNGRRAGVAPIGDETGTDFVDVNQFPLSMIERVEILTDGASALYGSEAVAGVVNIVTRKGFEGFELTADYRDATNESWSLSMATGATFDKGSFNAYATYYGQTGNSRSDFDFIDERVLGNGNRARSRLLSTTGAPGSYLRAVLNADGLPETLPGAVRTTDPDCLAAGGIFRQNDDGSFDTSRCRFDFTDQVDILADESRAQLFVEFDYDISSGVTFFSEGSFSRNVAKSPQGARFFANGATVGDNEGRIFIPSSHPFNFYIEDPTDPAALVYIGPDAWDPAVHTAVDLTCECRPLGADFVGDGATGDRRTQYDYMRYVAGLDWSVSDNWDARLSYTWAAGNLEFTSPQNFRADLVNELVASGEFNPFGTATAFPNLVSPKDGVSISGNSADTIQKFDGQTVSTRRTDQQVVDAVLTGPIAELPSGSLGFAIGAQYRLLKQDINPDSLEAADEANNPGLQFPVSNEQDVWATFAEAAIPVTERLELSLALRYEDFGGSVGSTTDPKIAARFDATDWLSVRGSFGTSFRAPTLNQTAESQTAVFVDDPAVPGPGGAVCGPGGPSTLIFVSNRGADDLKPQSADNINLGTIFRPVDGMSVSVDYWSFDYTDLIAASESAQAILNSACAGREGLSPIDDARIVRAGSGSLSRVFTEFGNVGGVETDGVDLAFTYSFPEQRFGVVDLRAKATFINKFEVNDGGTTFDAVGSRNFSNAFGPQPEWRSNLGLDWSTGNHAANVTVYYIDSYKNDQSNDAQVDSHTTVDLQYVYSLQGLLGGSQSSIVIGAVNVFDEDPPALNRLDSNGNLITGLNQYDRPGYDPRVFDVRGRQVYVRYQHAF